MKTKIIQLKRDIEILLKNHKCDCILNNIGISKGEQPKKTYECPRCSVLRRLKEIQEEPREQLDDTTNFETQEEKE